MTDQAELKEMFQKPTIKRHRPTQIGDKGNCDFTTGHCTNTSACNDCRFYQTVHEVRAYEDALKGY